MRFLKSFSRAALLLGSPTYRIIPQVERIAEVFQIIVTVVLEGEDVIQLGYIEPPTIDAKIFYIQESPRPTFNVQALDQLARLYHDVYNDLMPAGSAADAIDHLCKTPKATSVWFQAILAFFTCAVMCSLGFGGSLPDMGVAGCLGLLQALAGHIGAKNEAQVAYESGCLSFLNLHRCILFV